MKLHQVMRQWSQTKTLGSTRIKYGSGTARQRRITSHSAGPPVESEVPAWPSRSTMNWETSKPLTVIKSPQQGQRKPANQLQVVEQLRG